MGVIVDFRPPLVPFLAFRSVPWVAWLGGIRGAKLSFSAPPASFRRGCWLRVR